MKFYYIWAKLFSFESKNTYKIDIRNMSHKNALKMINIQKSYSVHFVLFNPHWFCLVYVGPIGSIRSTLILFYLLMSYLVQIGYIQSIQSTLDLFGPYWSYSVHSIQFGPIQYTLFTSVLFSRYWSYSVHYGPICSYLVHMSTWVLIFPFILIQSYLVHLVSI